MNAQPELKTAVRDGKPGYYDTLLLLSVTCHHAATDGWHIQRFLRELQALMDGFHAILG